MIQKLKEYLIKLKDIVYQEIQLSTPQHFNINKILENIQHKAYLNK